MTIELERPDHLSDEAWQAIEQHNQRLRAALTMNDLPWVIGSAKELVESVARAVLDAKGVVLGSNADFASVVNEAHKALERQPGVNVSLSPEVRAIAASSRKIVLAVRDIRNDVGTGHGRGRLDRIDEEKVTVVVDAAGLWTRWALRRLEHMLLREADNLIAELREAIVSGASLAKHLKAVVLPDQPSEMQRALGVAFAQRSAGGTFVARIVGVDGPSTSEDLKAWPPEYRLGIVAGLVLSSAGYLSLSESWVPTVVAVVSPLPPTQLVTFLQELNSQVALAGTTPSRSDEELHALAETVREHADKLPVQARSEWSRLADLIDPIEDVS